MDQPATSVRPTPNPECEVMALKAGSQYDASASVPSVTERWLTLD